MFNVVWPLPFSGRAVQNPRSQNKCTSRESIDKYATTTKNRKSFDLFVIHVEKRAKSATNFSKLSMHIMKHLWEIRIFRFGCLILYSTLQSFPHLTATIRAHWKPQFNDFLLQNAKVNDVELHAHSFVRCPWAWVISIAEWWLCNDWLRRKYWLLVNFRTQKWIKCLYYAYTFFPLLCPLLIRYDQNNLLGSTISWF